MTKLNIMFAFVVTLLILLFGLSDSVAQSELLKIENEPELTALQPRSADEICDFINLHPKKYVEQLTQTNVNGRIRYVLGTRIAGKSHILENSFRSSRT